MIFRRVAVVGVGIGGLTAAVALARAGVRCTVFERRHTPESSGAGLQISPNSAAVPHDLGLERAFDTAARPVCREIRRWRDDTLLGRTALGPDAVRRHGAPCYTVRRSTLIRALLEAVRRAQGPTAVRFGRRCVAYPIDGGRTLSIVATLPAPVPPAATLPADLLTGHAGWHPAVRGLLSLPAELEPLPLYDRDELPRWHRGRLAVLGDAAHPMLPTLAQGAAQAIEDAATLARCLPEPDALVRYQALRASRARRITAASSTGMHVHHLRDGPAQRRRDRATAVAPQESLDWLSSR